MKKKYKINKGNKGIVYYFINFGVWLKQHFPAKFTLDIKTNMKMFLAIMLTFSFGIKTSMAQLPAHKFSIGFNPLGIAESQLFVGPTVSVQFSPKYEVWTEIGAILRNNYMPKEWTSMRGFRFILQGRRLSHPNKKSFIGVEFRLKNFSSNDVRNFVNENLSDTLFNHPYRQNQTILGGAVVLGAKHYLDKSHRLFLENTVGFGIKQRFTKAQNIPLGYKFPKPPEGGPGLSINYDDVALPYVSLGLRLMWTLGKN